MTSAGMAGLAVVPIPPGRRWGWLTLEADIVLREAEVIVARGPEPPAGVGIIPEWLPRVGWAKDPLAEIVTALTAGRRTAYLAAAAFWSDPVVRRLIARPDLARWVELVPGPWRETPVLDYTGRSGAGREALFPGGGRDPAWPSSDRERAKALGIPEALWEAPRMQAGGAEGTHGHAWPFKPLRGRLLVALRDGERARRALLRLERLGARTAVYPLLDLVPPDDSSALDATLGDLSGYDWILFSSAEAVRMVMGRIRAVGGDARRIRGKVAAVGPATQAALLAFGIVADVVASERRQEGLASALAAAAGDLRGQAILLPGGNLNRSWLREELLRRGAKVRPLVVYENRPRPLGAEARARFRQGAVDGVLFSSAATVARLHEELGGEASWLAPAVAFSIGPETSRALVRAGVGSPVEARTASWDALAEVTAQYWIDRGTNPPTHESEE